MIEDILFKQIDDNGCEIKRSSKKKRRNLKMDFTIDYEFLTDSYVNFLSDHDADPGLTEKYGYVLLESPTPLYVLVDREDFFEELSHGMDEGSYTYIGRKLVVVTASGIFLLRAVDGRVVADFVLAPQAEA